MATCDHPSELVYGIAYPRLQRPGLRIDPRIAVLPAEEERHTPIPPSQQGVEEGSLFREIEAGAKLGQNPLAGTGALALQCLFLLAVVVIPLLHTDPLPRRETLTMLYLQPPAAAGSATKFLAPTPPSRSVFTPTSSGIPAPVHKTQEAAPPPVGAMGGVVGGVPGGMVGGVPGGVFSGILNSAPSVPVLAKLPVPTPVKRIRVAARVAEANLIRDVAPQYPPEAGRARLEGMVVLMAVIDQDGSVKDVRVESGLPILAQAAIDAVKQWRYKPYLVDGEPVEVDSRITINFTLSGA
jgi:periplasmic protein TonB